MVKSQKVQLRNKVVQKYLKGYPLIEKEHIEGHFNQMNEGAILELFSGKKFIARGYYGRQNKGYGWVLTKESDELINKKFFKRKLEKAFDLRRDYRLDETTTAYRLFNGEGDGIGGLTIDYLDGHYLITWYSNGIYSFKSTVLEALKEIVEYKSIYEKKRFDAKGQYITDDDFVMGDEPEFPLMVKENNVTFPVYLNDGPMIGFFLDQKDVRNKLRESYSKGCKVLNTFSYTGAFSVYAALGGASETTSVDVAKRSRPRTREMFEVNHINLENQKIVVEDVFNYFKYALRKGFKYDVVILDPPSFARTKKRTFSVAKDYSALLEEAIAITEVNGVIVASTNYSVEGMEWFKKQVLKAFSNQNHNYKILETYQLPDDFVTCEQLEGSNYLKVLFLQKLEIRKR